MDSIWSGELISHVFQCATMGSVGGYWQTGAIGTQCDSSSAG